MDGSGERDSAKRRIYGPSPAPTSDTSSPARGGYAVGHWGGGLVSGGGAAPAYVATAAGISGAAEDGAEQPD